MAIQYYGETRMAAKLSSRPASLCCPSDSATFEARRHKLKRCKLYPEKDSEKERRYYWRSEVLWVMFPAEESILKTRRMIHIHIGKPWDVARMSPDDHMLQQALVLVGYVHSSSKH